MANVSLLLGALLFGRTPVYVAILAAGALGLYIAARFATAALLGTRGYAGASASNIALGHWAPIAAVCMLAVENGRADIALSVLFATSVACLALALGMTALLSPPTSLPETRRTWPFILPAGLMVLIGGFSSTITITQAMMLLLIGVFVFLTWKSCSEADAQAESLLAAVAASSDPSAATPIWVSIVQFVLSIALAFLAAFAVLKGLMIADATDQLLRASVLVAGAVGPALVLPLLAAGTDLAQRGRSGVACSACVGVALLNLFGLLPLLAIGWWIHAGKLLPVEPSTGLKQSTFQRINEMLGRVPAMPLPLSVWRVDTVMLAAIGLALLPAAVGRWKIGRIEAAGLLAGYAGYLAVKALLAIGPYT